MSGPLNIRHYAKSILGVLFRGGWPYYTWMTSLTVLVVIGVAAYSTHISEGLYVTNMRDQVSWGLYIANFAFLVGIAAAAVLLIIPAYIYNFRPIKEIVVFGELLAVVAILMAGIFITIDMGGPERVWHMLPFLGTMNFPMSVLAWDMIVLTVYMSINLASVLIIGANRYFGSARDIRKVIIPIVLVSIPLAVGVHTVTAFVFNGLSARPFWNASILAPRFLASAFCSGPAVMIIIFQVLKKVMDFRLEDAAISKLAEIIAFAMGMNLFLLGSELYKEYYSATEHLSPVVYLYQGLMGHDNLVPWIWAATFFNITAFLLFLVPGTRKNIYTLNLGCVLIFTGIWVEKGLGLIVPGFIPDGLGEIYEYMPSMMEVLVTVGVWAFGAMAYTLLVRAAIAIDTGRLRHPRAAAGPPVNNSGETA